jgi:hypothetical protein
MTREMLRRNAVDSQRICITFSRNLRSIVWLLLDARRNPKVIKVSVFETNRM